MKTFVCFATLLALSSNIAVAQMCSGSVTTIPYSGWLKHENSCGLHPEITSICGGTIALQHGGTAVYELSMQKNHGDIDFQVISSGSGSLTALMALEGPGGCDAASGCIFTDSAKGPSAIKTLPSTAPAGTYHLFVTADPSSRDNCGEFDLVVEGDFGTPEDQSISFSTVAPTDAKTGETYTVIAAASSGLSITLDVDPASSSACSLDGSTSGSVVSYTAPGTCIVRANQSGNEFYNAAPQAVQSFNIAPGAPTSLSVLPKKLSNGVAGSPLVDPLEVREYDNFGNQVVTDSASSISVVANGPGHLRGEPVSAHVKFGSVIFDGNLILDKAGTYSLTAESDISGVTSATTNAFDVVPSSGTNLQFLSKVESAIKQGDRIEPVVVGEFDDFGNPARADNSTVIKLTTDSCGAIDIASGTLTSGEVIFEPETRFHSISASIKLTATSPATSAPAPISTYFAVIANDDFLFFNSFETCIP